MTPNQQIVSLLELIYSPEVDQVPLQLQEDLKQKGEPFLIF